VVGVDAGAGCGLGGRRGPGEEEEVVCVKWGQCVCGGIVVGWRVGWAAERVAGEGV